MKGSVGTRTIGLQHAGCQPATLELHSHVRLHSTLLLYCRSIKTSGDREGTLQSFSGLTPSSCVNRKIMRLYSCSCRKHDLFIQCPPHQNTNERCIGAALVMQNLDVLRYYCRNHLVPVWTDVIMVRPPPAQLPAQPPAQPWHIPFIFCRLF